MSGLSAADLAGIQAVTNTFLPDSGTVIRTGTQVSCRVELLVGRRDRIPGMPELPVWTLETPVGTDLRVGDQVVVTGKGTYQVMGAASPVSYPTAVVAQVVLVPTVADPASLMLYGAPVACSTTRRQAPTGQITPLSVLNLFPLMGILLQPVSPQAMFEQFGTQVVMPFRVYAEWPSGTTADLPVEPNDVITETVSGKKYSVFGIQPYAGICMVLYIQVLSV